MDLDEYYQDLRNKVSLRADVENDYTSASFMAEVAEELEDAGEIENLVLLHFEGMGQVGADSLSTATTSTTPTVRRIGSPNVYRLCWSHHSGDGRHETYTHTARELSARVPQRRFRP